MRKLIVIALLALLCACQPQPKAWAPPDVLVLNGRPQAPQQARPLDPAHGVFEVSPTIDIDRPATYPPMPAGIFTRTDGQGCAHYEVVAELKAIMSSGRSHKATVGEPPYMRTAASTVLLFADGTGLVLYGPEWPVVQSGLVKVEYGTPPGTAYMRPVAVMLYGCRSIVK